mmetsp:Transcript_30325/g.77085  ORF Transcript_30325/g.77085 Transcript_30325/m.77085 type:complete len:237 (-) Transcript_30325:2-712(-)
MVPKTLPWLVSVVTSATMPLAMGRSEASMAPLMARRTNIGVTSSTKARTQVIRPCITHPRTMMDLRDMIARSAKVPQIGEARLPAMPWIRFIVARWLSVRPRLACSAKKTQGSSAPSAPSRPPTAQRKKRSLALGLFGVCCRASAARWVAGVFSPASSSLVFTIASRSGAVEITAPEASQLLPPGDAATPRVVGVCSTVIVPCDAGGGGRDVGSRAVLGAGDWIRPPGGRSQTRGS